jgi:hypothetical protein
VASGERTPEAAFMREHKSFSLYALDSSSQSPTTNEEIT